MYDHNEQAEQKRDNQRLLIDYYYYDNKFNIDRCTVCVSFGQCINVAKSANQAELNVFAIGTRIRI